MSYAPIERLPVLAELWRYRRMICAARPRLDAGTVQIHSHRMRRSMTTMYLIGRIVCSESGRCLERLLEQRINIRSQEACQHQ
jgi:hypothetical protein